MNATMQARHTKCGEILARELQVYASAKCGAMVGVCWCGVAGRFGGANEAVVL